MGQSFVCLVVGKITLNVMRNTDLYMITTKHDKALTMYMFLREYFGLDGVRHEVMSFGKLRIFLDSRCWFD